MKSYEECYKQTMNLNNSVDKLTSIVLGEDKLKVISIIFIES